MAVKLFAAVVIGSTETEMKIFELSPRKGMREIDCVSTRINLGVDAYSKGYNIGAAGFTSGSVFKCLVEKIKLGYIIKFSNPAAILS